MSENQQHENMGEEFERAAAEADAVAASMAEADTGAEPGQGEAEPAKKISNAEICADALRMVRVFPPIAGRFPSAVALLTDEAIAEFADAFGALCDKYGWDFSGGFGEYAVEIRAALVCGGFAWGFAQAVAADLAKARAEAAKPVEPAAPPMQAADAPADSSGASVLK
ncbi:MAG: hypothetical protein EG825_10315 [Rhodocyclaceae bacterium]|nr:hypothetical protein [Rhodocyclaceae bacterium]